MIYPKFLENNSTIGICAPSDGKTDKLDLIRLDNAYKNLRAKGYNIIENSNVRKSNHGRSASAKIRAKDLNTMFENKNIDLIISASGGEFMLEILPYINHNVIKNNPKWFCGYSDNTAIVFILPTIYDIASIYGDNISAFGMSKWHSSIDNYLNILTGNIITQHNFSKYQSNYLEYKTGLESYKLDKIVKWKNLNNEKEIILKGRIIGGCLDILLSLVGTKYDHVKDFNTKYKNDGIIWFLESCELSSEQIIRGLWQLKEAGWFNNTKGFIFGRTILKTTNTNTSYESAINTSLEDLKVPIIIDADFGHTNPRMTIINGALTEIYSSKENCYIKFFLK